MALTTDILAGARTSADRAAQTRRTAAELEAALAAARAEEEQAQRDAAKAARAHEQWLKSARLDATKLVEQLERRAADIRAVDNVQSTRPPVTLRVHARTFLHPHGGIVETAPVLLSRIGAEDPYVAALGVLQRDAGQAMGNLAHYGIGDDDELMDRLDAVECTAWGGMVARIRELAGES